MKRISLLVILLLIATGASVYGEDSHWDSALRVESTDALDQYWKLSETPSMEAHMAILHAGGSSSLTATLEILVREDGTVAARVVKSSGNDEFDRAILAATEQMKFVPAPGNEARQPVTAPFPWSHGR